MTVRVVLLLRIVAEDAAVAARLQRVDRPFGDVEAERRLAEEDAAVRRDVEIVGKAHARIVDDREPASVGLVRQLDDLAVGPDHVEAHARDADDEIVVAVEREAERPAADMGEDLPRLVIGAEEPHDVAIAIAAIEMAVAVDDDVFRTFDLPPAR